MIEPDSTTEAMMYATARIAGNGAAGPSTGTGCFYMIPIPGECRGDSTVAARIAQDMASTWGWRAKPAP